jgi:hypothetical protein
MDDREFSSPVCYLDYENHPVPAAKPAEPVFCTTCTSFIAAMHTKVNQECGSNLETLTSGKKLKFILNEEGWVYKTTENRAGTAAKGCPLCIVIFEGLGDEDRKRLITWRVYGKEAAEKSIYEFKWEIRDGGIGFRLVSSPPEDDAAHEERGQLSHGLEKATY